MRQFRLTREKGRKGMRRFAVFSLALAAFCASAADLRAQALGQPDRDAPGDRMIQDYLARIEVRYAAEKFGDHTFEAACAVIPSPAWKPRRAPCAPRGFRAPGSAPSRRPGRR